jgi:hypothetical protein
MKPITLLVILVFLLTISVPFLIASRSAGPEYVFGGFLANPIDGNTYLSKMYQGYLGSWKFTLAYTAEPGEGVYLFLVYLLLGHIAHWSGMSMLLVFHLARVIGGLLLLASLYRFLTAYFPSRRIRDLAFALAALGAGMGWAASLVGMITSDLWVAEGYPFLASYTNPHFPLAIAIMLWLLTPLRRTIRGALWIAYPALLIIAGSFLALMSPFGLVIVNFILGSELCISWLKRHITWLANYFPTSELAIQDRSINIKWLRLIFPLAGGLPWMFYQVWVTQTHPVLSGWNAQNLTPTPPPWDILLALSPALLLAVYGAWLAIKRRNPSDWLFVIWIAGALVLMYMPINLQLRFMIGLYVPVAALAARAIQSLGGEEQRRFRNVTAGVFLFTLPTNVFLLLAAFFSIQTHQETIYLTKGESRAMQWIEKNTPVDSIILAAPDTGLLIPAHTGRRVLYGHPFETVNALEEKAWVERFFRGELSLAGIADFLTQRKVDYIFYGPRERKLGPFDISQGVDDIYNDAGVTLYAVSR